MSNSQVKSEITGKVWKVEVAIGDVIDEDDPIVILESMKMEIPVAAPFKCRILELYVAEEDPVAEDQPVALVEKL